MTFGEEKEIISALLINLSNKSQIISGLYKLVVLIKLLLLINIQILSPMLLEVFLMNICVVMIALLIIREIKLKKAR